MKWLFILNPGAGRKRRRVSFFKIIDRVMQDQSDPYEVVKASQMPDISKLAQKAADSGFDVAVAVGGDGTVREAATVLAGSKVLLGILPAGSGNAVARELRIPLEPESAVRSLLKARPVKMDVGRVNGRLFLMAAGSPQSGSCADHSTVSTNSR